MSITIARPGGLAGADARVPTIRQADASLGAYFAELKPDWHSQWAWDHYEGVVLSLARRFRLTELCEIGGGRDPLFQPGMAATRGLNLTVNDIDQHELDCAPPGLSKARFDIAGDLSEPRRGPAATT